jgi:hypothetical protein
VAVVRPLRRILLWGAVAALLLVPVAMFIGHLVAGRPGLWGGLIGALVPLGFFGVTVVVGLLSARMSATALGVVVLGSWLGKMAVLIVVLASLRGADFYDRVVLGVVLLVGTVVVLLLEALVVVRTRVPYVDPGT